MTGALSPVSLFVIFLLLFLLLAFSLRLRRRREPGANLRVTDLPAEICRPAHQPAGRER